MKLFKVSRASGLLSQQRFVDEVCKLACTAVAVAYALALQQCLKLAAQLLRFVLEEAAAAAVAIKPRP